MSLKKKIILTSLVILIISTVIVVFIIWPTIKDIRKINQDIYNERVALEKKYLRGQLLRKTLKDFEEIKPNINKITAVFVPENKELEFITSLEKIASKNGVEQEIELQAKNIKTEKGIKILPLKLLIKGNFIQVLKYLKELENLNYYFNISVLSINTQNQTINLTATGEAYSQPLMED